MAPIANNSTIGTRKVGFHGEQGISSGKKFESSIVDEVWHFLLNSRGPRSPSPNCAGCSMSLANLSTFISEALDKVQHSSAPIANRHQKSVVGAWRANRFVTEAINMIKLMLELRIICADERDQAVKLSG
jgi:hypothetical protein